MDIEEVQQYLAYLKKNGKKLKKNFVKNTLFQLIEYNEFIMINYQ